MSERDRRKPGWVLDELATAGRENLDPVHASQCDAKEGARAADEVQLLVQLGLDDTKDVVDLMLEPMIERCGFRLESAVRSADGFFAEYVARAV